MKKKKAITLSDMPSLAELEDELERVKYQNKYKKYIISTTSVLIVVAAISVLIATLWMPVLRIYGNSMTPTLSEGNIVISLKADSMQQGDVVAFYYNNKILVKRVIAGPGDWVDISYEGDVTVNGAKLDEPYVSEKSFGDCDIDLPYQVPESRYFVLGDHRSVSADSRKKEIGCVAEEQVVGSLEFCIWPLSAFGFID